MKKLIVILMCMSVTEMAFGITLCKRTNTAVAVINKSVNGTKISAVENEWVVSMNDGITVRGKSLCSEMPGVKDQVNTGVADTIDSGPNCFCKMMGPATSYWVYLQGYETASNCESGCSNICGDHMATDTSFRSAVYEAIW